MTPHRRSDVVSRLALGLAVALSGVFTVLSAQDAEPPPRPPKPVIRQTRESVPWAMAGYKFLEFYHGKEGHREVYDGQEITVTALVSDVEALRSGGTAILLQDGRIMALSAEIGDAQFAAVHSFFMREKAQVKLKAAEYQNFYLKATVRGTCGKSMRPGKIDLKDASVIAWYGVRVLRVGRGLSFDIAERSLGERVPHYQRLDWGRERQTLDGPMTRLHAISRQFIVTVGKTPCLMDADPLSLATEAWRICEMCKVNAITAPLELSVAAYPADELARRMVETSIVGWRATNPLLRLYDLVNNIGGEIGLQPPETGVPEAATVEVVDADADRAVAQAFAVAANNLLAARLDDPKGRLYLAVARHLLPDHPQLAELEAGVAEGKAPSVSSGTVSDLDLAERVSARIATLAAGRSLHNPLRRQLCAFYVAVARQLGAEDAELKPVLLSLEMLEQPVGELPALLGDTLVVTPGSDEIGDLERQVRGNDPVLVDQLLARAETLAVTIEGNERLDAVINRLTQYRRFWDEPVPCPACDGKGKVEAPCATCDGNGKLPCKRCRWTGRITEKKPCATCKGTGKRFGVMACKECGGTGSVEVEADCPDCAGSGNVPCPDCQDTGKSVTPCAACSGTGFRPRRDLPRPGGGAPAPSPGE